MSRIASAAKFASPLNRATVALWAWRHRDEIAGWAGYAARAMPRLVGGDTADVLAEGRLRARLTANGKTRDVPGLDVSVVDGVAHLRGSVSVDVADAVREIATDTAGVRRVRDDLTVAKKRRGRR